MYKTAIESLAVWGHRSYLLWLNVITTTVSLMCLKVNFLSRCNNLEKKIKSNMLELFVQMAEIFYLSCIIIIISSLTNPKHSSHIPGIYFCIHYELGYKKLIFFCNVRIYGHCTLGYDAIKTNATYHTHDFHLTVFCCRLVHVDIGNILIIY